MPERTVAMVGEAFETMIDASDSVHRSASFLERVTRIFAKVFIPLVLAMFLTVAGLIVIVVIQRNRAEDANDRINKLEGIVESLRDSSDETRDAARSAKTAAESANTTLQSAIASSSQQSQGTSEAVNKINEIYETCVVKHQCGQ